MNKLTAAKQALLLLKKSKGTIEDTDIDLTIETYKLTDEQISDFIVWINQNDLTIELVDESVPETIDNAYYVDISKYPLLTREQEVALAEKIKNGDKIARETLIKSNLRLVVAIARKYQGSQLTINDLIQEGNIGLLKAVNRFDANKGVRFANYAQYWIRQAISRAITQNHVIYLPANLGETLQKLKRVQKKLEQELEEKPTSEMIAKEMEISVEEVEELLNYSFDAISMDKPLDDDGEISLYDIIADETDFMEEIDTKILQDYLRESLQQIPERDAQIIRMRFGLDDNVSLTLQQIAEHFSLTKEGVRQIINSNLLKLKNSQNLSDFMEKRYDK
ncbi:MAG: sigma-70 family RNA polymerase sigma factor [Erysipelotrichaceae bacterium]|nr:sigma-70 family RNA polymerase sigma factor [Erysipelotrichaceae bacterium]